LEDLLLVILFCFFGVIGAVGGTPPPLTAAEKLVTARPAPPIAIEARTSQRARRDLCRVARARAVHTRPSNDPMKASR